MNPQGVTYTRQLISQFQSEILSQAVDESRQEVAWHAFRFLMLGQEPRDVVEAIVTSPRGFDSYPFYARCIFVFEQMRDWKDDEFKAFASYMKDQGFPSEARVPTTEILPRAQQIVEIFNALPNTGPTGIIQLVLTGMRLGHL